MSSESDSAQGRFAEPSKPSMGEILASCLRPTSPRRALDPFKVKLHSKRSLPRMIWTGQSRLLEMFAVASFQSAPLPFGAAQAVTLPDRGDALTDTAVTAGQLHILERMVDEAESVDGDLAEIGSYRGVTTAALAARTSKIVYAVDPFSGYGAGEDDFKTFRSRTRELRNIIHIRESSGAASARFEPSSLSAVFVDAVHDFSNSWFDFLAWSGKVREGGFVALHDVDDHPGVRFTAKQILSQFHDYEVWGYCPNLLVLRKI